MCAVSYLQLLIWSPSAQAPVQRHDEHKAAIKAIAWSPHQHGVLASGGGTADRTIRFWNTLTGHPLQSIDTGSQVRRIKVQKKYRYNWGTHNSYIVNNIGDICCLVDPVPISHM